MIKILHICCASYSSYQKVIIKRFGVQMNTCLIRCLSLQNLVCLNFQDLQMPQGVLVASKWPGASILYLFDLKSHDNLSSSLCLQI